MKAHTKAILSWRNILTNKLTLINDKRTFFQLLFHLEKARKRRLISHVVLSVDVGILRANNICHCMHTSLSLSLYTLLWLHLMCPDGLDLNLFIHTHIDNLFLFQSDSGVGMSRERNEQSNWENVIDANGTSSFVSFLSFMQYFIYPFLLMIHVWLNSRNVLI